MINIFAKVTKEAVDNSRPNTALLFLKFRAILKAEQKLSDLKLTFKGMRDEDTLIITSDDLQSMQIRDGTMHKNIYFY